MRIPTILAVSCLLLASCKKEGCTDASAYNFNPDAELEDGTCQYSGCTDQLASNYDEGAAVNDGSCEYGGCMDPGAVNYDETATIDDGSCDYLGCTDSEAVNYDETATIDDGSCDYLGCTDSEAVNYDDTATIDDGSCVFLEDLQPSIDGYTYGVVQIGDQVWFSENLRTTVYSNGDAIPGGLTDGEWASTTAGATAVYGEGDSFCAHLSPDIDACDEVQSLAAYGRLYNGYAVDDARGLCPAGWHVPTDGEWTELEDYITSQGFDGTEGVALKSTYGWNEQLGGGSGTDDFGFSALPGGSRGYLGDFSYAGDWGHFWSSSSDYNYLESATWYRMFGTIWDQIHRNNTGSVDGFSVRCLWDAE